MSLSDEKSARWKRNEDELNRIANMSGLDQQLCAKREEELLDEQDAIEFHLGFDAPELEQPSILTASVTLSQGLQVRPFLRRATKRESLS